MDPYATAAIVSAATAVHPDRICNCSPSALLRWVISAKIEEGDLTIALHIPLTYNLQYASPTW